MIKQLAYVAYFIIKLALLLCFLFLWIIFPARREFDTVWYLSTNMESDEQKAYLKVMRDHGDHESYLNTLQGLAHSSSIDNTQLVASIALNEHLCELLPTFSDTLIARQLTLIERREQLLSQIEPDLIPSDPTSPTRKSTILRHTVDSLRQLCDRRGY